jgi:hypothetical protein
MRVYNDGKSITGLGKQPVLKLHPELNYDIKIKMLVSDASFKNHCSTAKLNTFSCPGR